MSDLGQKELDKLNPKATPTPDPTNTSNPQPSPTPTSPAPSPTPTQPAPSPTPTVTANPSPTPTTPAPSPTPTVTATPTPPAPSPTPTVVPKAGADKFNVPALDTPKVDMLFCIDNSGSMDDKQQVLADSMSTFINQFVMGGVDYHIGIVTTDVDSTDAKYWSNRLPNYVTPNRGRLLSRYNEKFLTKNSSNVVDKMKANAKVGTAGSGNEQCFNSMLYALEDSMIASGGYNENFIREDALLSMIVVSDEDEQISNGEGVAGRIDRMKKRISAIKGPNSRGFSFDFVINKTASKPASVTYPLTASVNSYPNFYFAAADAFVSKTYDVLKNFGGDLAKIGSDIVVASTSQFKLSNKPNPVSSIVVKLDGKVVAADPVNGYVYDASNNSITLKGDALQASPGGVLTIDYLY